MQEALLIENFFEPYHEQLVHATITKQPLADHYKANGLGYSDRATGETERTDIRSADSGYHTLFPNFVFGLHLPDQIDVHLNVPLAPDRTHQRRVIYSLGRDSASTEQRDQLAALWHEAFLEARIVCEWLQQERASNRAAKGGARSPVWKDTVRSFQERVVSHLR